MCTRPRPSECGCGCEWLWWTGSCPGRVQPGSRAAGTPRPCTGIGRLEAFLPAFLTCPHRSHTSVLDVKVFGTSPRSSVTCLRRAVPWELNSFLHHLSVVRAVSLHSASLMAVSKSLLTLGLTVSAVSAPPFLGGIQLLTKLFLVLEIHWPFSLSTPWAVAAMGHACERISNTFQNPQVMSRSLRSKG